MARRIGSIASSVLRLGRQRSSQVEMGETVARLLGDRPFELRLSVFEPLHLAQRESPGVVQAGKGRPSNSLAARDSNRAVEGPQTGLKVLVDHHAHQPGIVGGGREEVGVEFQCSLEHPARLVVLVVRRQQVAQIVVRRQAVGVESYGLSVGFDRVFGAPESTEGRTSVDVRARGFRVQLDRAVQGRKRPLWIALLNLDPTEHLVRRRQFGVGLARRRERLARFVESARPLVFEPLVEALLGIPRIPLLLLSAPPWQARHRAQDSGWRTPTPCARSMTVSWSFAARPVKILDESRTSNRTCDVPCWLLSSV